MKLGIVLKKRFPYFFNVDRFYSECYKCIYRSYTIWTFVWLQT